MKHVLSKINIGFIIELLNVYVKNYSKYDVAHLSFPCAFTNKKQWTCRSMEGWTLHYFFKIFQ